MCNIPSSTTPIFTLFVQSVGIVSHTSVYVNLTTPMNAKWLLVLQILPRIIQKRNKKKSTIKLSDFWLDFGPRAAS